MPLVSMREYARIRGTSHTAVRKAIQTGRLKVSVVSSEQGSKTVYLIDSDMASREWPLTEVRVDNSESLDEPRKSEVEPAPELKSFRPSADEGELDDSSNYYKARAVREDYQARLAKFKFEQESAKLVDAEEVNKAWTQIAATVRTKVLGIPSKARQRVPEFTHDQYLILEAIVREALEDISEQD